MNGSPSARGWSRNRRTPRKPAVDQDDALQASGGRRQLPRLRIAWRERTCGDW